MSSRMDHVGVFVTDVDAAVQAFTTAFGLETSNWIEDTARRAAFLEWGGAMIELFEPSDPGAREALSALGGPVHHIGIAVPDLDAELERLAAAGFPVLGEIRVLGDRRTAFLDAAPLAGVRIQLIEPPTT